MNPLYKQKILAAVEYIESNLTQSLNLALISEHCHFSPFHFHRIFNGVMNETLNSYIGRKRLEKAVNLLVFKREVSITDIALDCGFSSSANFSKAVKQYFGYSPTDIRSPKEEELPNLGKLFSKYGKKFDPNDLYPAVIPLKQSDIEQVDVQVKTLPNKRMGKLESKNGYETESLFSTWDTLSEWVQGKGIVKEKQFKLAWCYDNPAVTPANKCKYVASIEIDNSVSVTKPFGVIDFPEGKYAVIYVKGSPDDITQAQMYLFNCWLPSSGYEPDNLPMLERYLNDVRKDGFLETEIMIKLKVLS